MSVYDGLKFVEKIKVGGETINKAIMGGEIVYDDTQKNNFYFKALSDQTVRYVVAPATPPQYSYDNINWSNWNGTKALHFGQDAAHRKLYLRNTNSGTSYNGKTYTFGNSTPVSAGGELMSMVNFRTNMQTSAFCFHFAGCSQLVDCSDMTITCKKIYPYALFRAFEGSGVKKIPKFVNVEYINQQGLAYCFFKCYNLQALIDPIPIISADDLSCQQMFNACSGLTTIPDDLFPNLTTFRGAGAFSGMFYSCTSLQNACRIPATAMASNCMMDMFWKCTKLTRVPYNMFKTTKMCNSCMANMFRECTSLTTLPMDMFSTIKIGDGYDGIAGAMFYGCTALTHTPIIPKLTTRNRCCWQYMFQNCTSLRAIYCLETNLGNIDGISIFLNWVTGVPSGGIFYKASGVNWPSGNSGVPSGWNQVVYAP